MYGAQFPVILFFLQFCGIPMLFLLLAFFRSISPEHISTIQSYELRTNKNVNLLARVMLLEFDMTGFESVKTVYQNKWQRDRMPCLVRIPDECHSRRGPIHYSRCRRISLHVWSFNLTGFFICIMIFCQTAFLRSRIYAHLLFKYILHSNQPKSKPGGLFLIKFCLYYSWAYGEQITYSRVHFSAQ